MKRIVSFLLVLVCFSSLFSFSAFAKYDGEILFRDIPWKSSYSEVKEQVADLDVEWKGAYNYAYRDILSMILIDGPEETRDYAYTSCHDSCYSDNLKIAGYPLMPLNFEIFFAFTDKDKRDLAHTSFYLAKYNFDGRKMTKTDIKNLEEKIASLYGGEYDKVATYNPSDSYFEFVVKTIYGKNGTELYFVTMRDVFSETKPSSVYVYYCQRDGFALAKRNMEELKAAEENNNDGL